MDSRIAVAGCPGSRGLSPSMKEAEEWLKTFTAKPRSADKIPAKPVVP
jgi:hypothetical protein